ncbi:hypothetical protein OROMI_014452 [Orobanche minor]
MTNRASSQNKSCVPPTYMAHQFDINERMRAILIDWIIKSVVLADLLNLLMTNDRSRAEPGGAGRPRAEPGGRGRNRVASVVRPVRAILLAGDRIAGDAGDPVCEPVRATLLAGDPVCDPVRAILLAGDRIAAGAGDPCCGRSWTSAGGCGAGRAGAELGDRRRCLAIAAVLRAAPGDRGRLPRRARWSRPVSDGGRPSPVYRDRVLRVSIYFWLPVSG